jgi:hypothetical protein
MATQRAARTGVTQTKPGSYAIGSPQSRAATRALLERRFEERKRVDIVSSIPRPSPNGEIRIGTWVECHDGSLHRFSSVPAGMTLEEAERIVSLPGWKPVAAPAQPERIRPPLKAEW